MRAAVGLVAGVVLAFSFTPGIVRPAVASARVSVQRVTAKGRWITLARGAVYAFTKKRSRYAVRVPRPSRCAALRVVVIPDDNGAHVRGISRALKIAGRF